MKSLDEYYKHKLYEDNLDVVFNPKEYTINRSTVKATADRLYDNLFNDIKNDQILYSYITQRGTGTDRSYDKKFLAKRFEVSINKVEFIRRYVALYNLCDYYNTTGDIVNLDSCLTGLKYLIQTLKDIKLWK